jgi:MFS family permease
VPAVADVEEEVAPTQAPMQVGGARAALAHRDFRRMMLGAGASSIGTWGQMAVLGAFAYKLTSSPTFVGIIGFAQLGPFLVIMPFSGVLADTHSRRAIILIGQIEQATFSLVLAFIAAQPEPNKVALVLATVCFGIGGSFATPAWESLMPTLVPRTHMAGAISVHSTQLNLTRVIGPVLGSILYHQFGAWVVFTVNAASYLFVFVAILSFTPPPLVPLGDGPRGMRRLVEGVQAVRADAVLRRATLTIAGMALFSLTFATQVPTVAHDIVGIDPKSTSYGLFYSSLGLGTVAGAFAIGTFLAHRDLRRVVRWMLVVLAGGLLVMASVDSPLIGFPLMVALGFCYMTVSTSLATIVQSEAPDHLRGRVTSLFTMSLAGVLPLGGLTAGFVADVTSMRYALGYGAVAALLLAWYARLHRELPSSTC